MLAVAAGGQDAAVIAAELGDGLFATDPDPSIVEAYSAAGGDGPRSTEVPLAYGPDEDGAAAHAHEIFRFGLLGWKVMSELPNPANFEASARFVREADVAKQMPCGPDAAKHLEAIRKYEAVGYDHVVLVNNGPDPDGFMDFFARELKPQLTA